MRVRVSQQQLKKKSSAHSAAGGSRERGSRGSPPKNSPRGSRNRDVNNRDSSPRTAARKAQEQHEASGGVGVVGLYDSMGGGGPKRKPPPKKKGGLIAGKKPDVALRRRSHKGLVNNMSQEDVSGSNAVQTVRRPSFAPHRGSKTSLGDAVVDQLILKSGMTLPGTYQDELVKEVAKSEEELQRVEHELMRLSQKSKDLDLEVQLRGVGDATTTDAWWSMKPELPPGYTRYLFTEEDQGLSGYTQPPPPLPSPVAALPPRPVYNPGTGPVPLASRLHFEQQQSDVHDAQTKLAELAASLGLE